MRSSKYTRERLAPLVASSRSVTEVIAKLGLANNGGNFRHIGASLALSELPLADADLLQPQALVL